MGRLPEPLTLGRLLSGGPRGLGVVGEGAGAHEAQGDPPRARSTNDFTLSPPQAGSGRAVCG